MIYIEQNVFVKTCQKKLKCMQVPATTAVYGKYD